MKEATTLKSRIFTIWGDICDVKDALADIEMSTSEAKTKKNVINLNYEIVDAMCHLENAMYILQTLETHR